MFGFFKSSDDGWRSTPDHSDVYDRLTLDDIHFECDDVIDDLAEMLAEELRRRSQENARQKEVRAETRVETKIDIHMQTLGLTSMPSTLNEFKKVGRSAFMKHHPDVDGSNEAFIKAKMAYDVLLKLNY